MCLQGLMHRVNSDVVCICDGGKGGSDERIL